MKKIIAMLLAIVMVLGLAACGGDKAPETTAPQGDTTPVETTPVETEPVAAGSVQCHGGIPSGNDSDETAAIYH